MFDPRSILDAIVKGSGAPEGRGPAGTRDEGLGSLGDLLKQISGGDGRGSDPDRDRGGARAFPRDRAPSDRDDPMQDEATPAPRTRHPRADADDATGAAPSGPEGGAARGPDGGAGGGLEDIFRDVLSGKGGRGLKDILDQVNSKGGIGEVLGPVLGQIFGQKAGGARLADVGGDGSSTNNALLDRLRQLSGGRSPEELMAAVKQLIAENRFGAGMAAGGLGALVLGTRSGRSLAMTAAKLGGLAVIGGLAYKAYSNYQQGAAAEPEANAHQKLIPPPAGSGFEPATVSQDLATTMLKAMVAAASSDGRVDPSENEKLVAGFGGSAMTDEARAFLAAEIASPASVEDIARHVTSQEQAVQVFTAARITVDPDDVTEHTFLSALARALGLDDGLVAHIDAAARGGA